MKKLISCILSIFRAILKKLSPLSFELGVALGVLLGVVLVEGGEGGEVLLVVVVLLLLVVVVVGGVGVVGVGGGLLVVGGVSGVGVVLGGVVLGEGVVVGLLVVGLLVVGVVGELLINLKNKNLTSIFNPASTFKKRISFSSYLPSESREEIVGDLIEKKLTMKKEGKPKLEIYITITFHKAHILINFRWLKFSEWLSEKIQINR